MYTKQAAGVEYPNSFANSVHFALCSGDGEMEELNQGCSILYALAKIRLDDTLMERGIKNPVIFEQDGQYGILAEYVYHCRCSTYRRVHFSAEGLPMLQVVSGRDVAAGLQKVQAEVEVGREERA